MFIFFVLNENRFASTIIQTENEQSVIKTGPYKFVRHPMYLGMLVILLFTPLALGSFYSIIPMCSSIPMLIYRIKNEETVPIKNLKGYEDYQKTTPFRLLPFIW